MKTVASESTIYILDDDVQYSGLLVELSTNAGWNVIAESNPVVFLEYTISPSSILVLDLNMPEMDGIEVIRALAERKIEFGLILVSGFDSRVLHSAQQLAEAHHIKVLASLSKPVVVSDFIRVLDEARSGDGVLPKKVNTKKSISAGELKKGIQEHELVIHYQPQIDIKTGTLRGVEALVRWEHPLRGMIYPNQFVPLAEEQGLIGILTEEVVSSVVEQSQLWHSEGLDVPVSINVSPENITSLGLPEQLKKLTEIFTIDPGMFTLEVTETAVMGKLTSSLDVLNRLRMKGFSLSIDDFGTGYSSLTKLYQAPFAEIKIDQHFVMRMLEDPEAMVIVEICIMLGKKLGMQLVAEGVETQAALDKLMDLGCDVAQGYFIAKPMTATDLFSWEQSRAQLSAV